jgi:hypothetical protein
VREARTKPSPSKLAPFRGAGQGWLNGDQIHLSFTSRYEGSTICYFFDGDIRDGSMSGTAMLGRRQRPEPRHRQPQPIRHWPLAGEPRREISGLTPAE